MNPEPMEPIRCLRCGRYLGAYRADFEARIEVLCRCKAVIVIESGQASIRDREKPPLTSPQRVAYP